MEPTRQSWRLCHDALSRMHRSDLILAFGVIQVLTYPLSSEVPSSSSSSSSGHEWIGQENRPYCLRRNISCPLQGPGQSNAQQRSRKQPVAPHGLGGMERPCRPAMPTRHKILSMDSYRLASGIPELDAGLPDQAASSVKAAKVLFDIQDGIS